MIQLSGAYWLWKCTVMTNATRFSLFNLQSQKSLQCSVFTPSLSPNKIPFSNRVLITPDKLLPGVSSYLGKPIIYEVKEIMEGTMDLNEHYKIGSIYRVKINGQVLAMKKTKDDVTEELRIL